MSHVTLLLITVGIIQLECFSLDSTMTFLAFKKIRKAFPKITGNWQFFDMYKHDFKYYDPNGISRL
jgi:hypothetical protein